MTSCLLYWTDCLRSPYSAADVTDAHQRRIVYRAYGTKRTPELSHLLWDASKWLQRTIPPTYKSGNEKNPRGAFPVWLFTNHASFVEVRFYCPRRFCLTRRYSRRSRAPARTLRSTPPSHKSLPSALSLRLNLPTVKPLLRVLLQQLFIVLLSCV